MSSSTITFPEDHTSPLVSAPTRRRVVCKSMSTSWFQRLAQRRILKWIEGMEGGTISFTDRERSLHFGEQSADSLQADWQVDDSDFYRLLAMDGSLGMAESYLRGHWHSHDLTSLLTILCRNLHRVPEANSLMVSLSNTANRLAKPFRRNTRSGSKRHIAAHYDLSNEFFELFLDPTMMYSAGYFHKDDSTLHEASVAKLDQICRKLDLNHSDSVLEIGTGWGGFALHAAERHDIDLTTTTISDAQLAKARQRFAAAGIADRVQLLDADYRDLDGQFDKLVSIEMVEAVGERYLDTYFRQCGRLLKPGGRFVVQAIVMPEQRYDAYRRGVDFIQKYIFPGGFLPSVAAMQESVGRTSNLRLSEVEDMSEHYARTLKAWRQRFFERIDDVRRLGFDDRFIRMWEYYLCYCEAAFRQRAVGVVQIVWDKPAR
jgi:cyclopropane-fatty-acyl-phospholipid synthase